MSAHDGPSASGERPTHADDGDFYPPSDILREAGDALAMATCPYFTHQGVCENGCREEPCCVTNYPDGGWVAEGRRLLSEEDPS